jgi:putative acetyltransferase
MAARSPVIRAFAPADAGATAQLFYESIHGGAAGAYTPEQLRAWAPAPPAVEEWAALLSAMTTLLAVEAGEPVGFMSLDTNGHIDRAFVRPDRLRTGVASALYAAIEERARERGLTRLTTDASAIARAFFERKGWRVVREQQPVRNGVALTNYRMEKHLD